MRIILMQTITTVALYAFCGVCLLVWAYLFISGAILRVRCAKMAVDERRARLAAVFSEQMEQDMHRIQRNAAVFFLLIAVFLFVIWLFGAPSEQATVQALLERCCRWLLIYAGAGVAAGTVLMLLMPMDAAAPFMKGIGRGIRRDSIKGFFVALLYFVIFWLIA